MMTMMLVIWYVISAIWILNGKCAGWLARVAGFAE